MMKIKHMIFLILILCSVMPLLIISGFGIQTYSDKMETLIENSLKSASSAQESAMEIFFAQRDVSLVTIGNLDDARRMFGHANSGEEEALAQLRPQIEAVLSIRVKESGVVESITLLDQSFRIIASTAPVKVGQISRIKQAPLSLPKGRTLFTDVVPAQRSSHNKSVFGGIRAIYDGDTPIGYVIEELNLSFFELMQKNVYMLDAGSLYIADGKGQTVAAGSRNMTLAEYWEQDRDVEDFYRQWEAQGARNKERGFLRFMSSGEKYLTYFTTLKYTNWHLFVAVNVEQTIKRENNLRKAGLLIGVILVSVLILVNYMISKRLARPVENLIEQISEIKENGDSSTRIRGMPSNEIGMIAGVFNRLLDHIEKSTSDLWQSKEKLHIIMNRTNHIFVERNYETNTFSVSSNFFEMLGYQLPEADMQHGIETFDIHPDDLTEYRAWFEASYKAKADTLIELRMKKASGAYIWVKLVFIPIVDQAGEVKESIGLISDIDREKQEVRRLQEKADLDVLTGVFNRSGLKNAMVNMIQEGNPSAVLFIDIDDFKSFNTIYGHLYGDKVLKFVANTIRKHVKGFAGRQGGDEFIACITEGVTVRDVETVAKRILDELSSGIVFEENGDQVNVYGSIGIAFYPQAAATFEELLQKADEAMYKVKESGKNNYFIIT